MSKSATAPAIVLFRRDLRIADNRALAAASETGNPVIALYILDDESPCVRPIGAASRWWLHHSLAELTRQLRRLGSTLVLKRGATIKVVLEVVKASGATTVLWNRRYDPADAAVDSAMKNALREEGVSVESFEGALLHEPSRLKTATGGFYKVYTPFWKVLDNGAEPRDPLDAPDNLKPWVGEPDSLSIDDLALLPNNPDWSTGLVERWTPGESAAHERLATFLEDDIQFYETRRNVPGEKGTSQLSPCLAFGEITPFQILAALRGCTGSGAAKFRKEIGWREFSYHLLFHNPQLSSRSFRPEFDEIGWRADPVALKAWQNGVTGYPIVDAGMRELWQTGWMHNRVRMIAASFLIKDLLIDWRHGEQWFWDTLVDADPANNPASWQWVAGSGADAAPYFRVFNPVLQGEKFDPEGHYVRRYLPELSGLPDRYIHRPWEAPPQVLENGNVTLGESYPQRIVDHATARDRALAAYKSTRLDQQTNTTRGNRRSDR